MKNLPHLCLPKINGNNPAQPVTMKPEDAIFKHPQEGCFVRVVIDEWPWERVGVIESVYTDDNIKVKVDHRPLLTIVVHRKDAEIISETEYTDWKNRIKTKTKTKTKTKIK